MDDITLLREYAGTDSEAAFATLVERYVNLVYSSALRSAGNPHAAEEITQAVFIILARKAGSLGAKTVLSGWLYRTAQLTAANYLRGEIRRQKREQEAYMQSLLSEPEPEIWPQIAPLLDDAMGRLGEKDRNAIVLRFFENKTLGEIGLALGASEDAAKMRVGRALEKLHRYFHRRGISSTTAIIAGTISRNSVHAAPAALAKTISAVALAKGAAVSSSTLTLVKGVLKIMVWTKAKAAIVAGAAAVLAVSTATIVVKVSFFPEIKDSYFQPNYRHFQNLPNGLFALRPTHFHTPTNGLDYSAEGSSPSGEHVTRMMGRNRSFGQLVSRIYNCGQFQIAFPADVPKGRYDYLFTIPDNHARERFEAVITDKLGYVASWQQHDTEVILLKIKTPNSPGLKPGTPSGNSVIWRNSQNRLEIRNRSLRSLADEIQNSANIPVMDETGLANAFDFDFDCSQADLANRNWDNVNQALGRLGLELVSTNMPMNMLVVEKAK